MVAPPGLGPVSNGAYLVNCAVNSDLDVAMYSEANMRMSRPGPI